VSVAFRGATNDSRTARIDRDGMLIIGQLNPIRAAGRSLGSVKADIASQTTQTLLATEAFVSVGRVRSISVFVGGEVERQGQYNLTSLSDVVTAIAQAGGIRQTGTLRQVRLVRANGSSQAIDLYGYLGIGRPSAVLLQDGDRIIVPVIGPTVGISGNVPRPGIYELRGTASIDEVTAFSGGSIRQRGSEIVISRIDRSGAESFLRPPSGSASVMGGDAITVMAASAGGAADRVELIGSMDNAGPRSLLAAPTVADLVGPAHKLRPGTYRPLAMLVRQDALVGSRIFLPLHLGRELTAGASTRLRPEDRLFVFSIDDVMFMNSALVRSVVLGQPNPLGQCRSLQRLSELVRDTASARFTAVTRGSLVVREGDVAGAIASVGTATTVQDTAALRRTDVVAGVTCPGVFEAEPDLLAALIENAVSVSGSVRRPGAFPIAEPTTARDILTIAEGLVPGTVDLVLDINRVSSPALERVATEVDRLGELVVAAGDDIRFNGRQPNFEPSGVLVAGEVMRPGLYPIRRGETLSQLLERAGGLTQYAYPFGAVFTRQSVKVAEQAGFQQTARQMNNALLALTSRSEGKTAEGLAGAAELIKLISNAPATGRVVVEADPRALAMRPDLDTTLEPGDSISVPKTPNYVLVLGDVLSPGAIQFVAGKSSQDYVRSAGGTMSTADEGRIFVVLPNGTAQPIRSGWASRSGFTPPPGSVIFVPKNVDPLRGLTVARDLAVIIGQVGLSIAAVAAITN
jgi:protein involved in polysaccharide export with SLBB domain